MVATRRRKSGEKSEDAKEKNGANGTKNGKASKGRSSGGLVAAAAVAVLAVAAGVALAPDTLKDQVRRSLGVSSAAPPRLAVKKEAPAADDVDPRIAADAAAALATQKKADEKIQRDRAARQARADARGLTLEQLEREETLERVRKSQADAAAKQAEAAAAKQAAAAAEAAKYFKLYVRNTAKDAELQVLGERLAPGAGAYRYVKTGDAVELAQDTWRATVVSFRTEGGKFALSFRNPQGQGPDTLEVKGGKVVTIAPGAAEAYVAGDGHHFWLKSEDRARGAGVAAYAVPAEEAAAAAAAAKE